MKRTSTQNKCLATGLMLIAMLLMSLGVKAQNVSIDLVHGSLLAAVTDAQETGFGAGFKALWRHEQLALSMTGTDRDAITATGEIAQPSAVFGEHNGKLTIVGGRRPSFIVVSLPKGYRITGYTLVLANDLRSGVYSGRFAYLNSNNQNESNDPSGPGSGEGTMRFYETKPWTTDGTNAGSTGRSNGSGYNANQVRYIELGTDWENGQIGTAASDVLAQAVDANNNGDIKTTDAVGKEYIISRTSMSENDMGNQLYFRLVKDYFFYGLTIKSFEIRFTAEGTFTTPVVPKETSETAVSVDASPFKTNKIDIGEMTPNTQEGTNNTFFSYQWKNVKDLDAYNYIYQSDAVQGGIPVEDVAPTKKIYKVENGGNKYYGLKNGIYYVETPISIENSAHNEAPIGYRIVGATINYTPGVKVTETIPGTTSYYITYTSSDGKTYYLNKEALFTNDKEYAAKWEIVNNNIHLVESQYYLRTGNNNNRFLFLDAENNRRLLVDEDNRLHYGDYYLQGRTDNNRPILSNNTNDSDLAVWTVETTTDQENTVFAPEEYQIQFYDKEGNKISEADGGLVTVHSNDPADSFDMGLLNNDAIMFEIKGVDSSLALVTIDLYLQALDPYIDKMDIVCTDDRKVLTLTQSFTADDFSVAGDKFIFYVPSDYANEPLTFTFSDLYSKYGDQTYYDHTGQGFGRYSFVTSEYFLDRVDGNGNGGLYGTLYDPDHPYNGNAVTDEEGKEIGRTLSKIQTSTAGKYRFKFNNAEDLAAAGQQNSGSLIEYPFSVYTYLHTKNPGDKTASPPIEASNDLGTFIDCKLQANIEDQKSGTYYVFTADETRYNIAPTTAWQHRFYAFYRMEIELRAKTFSPDFTWTKIYDETCYASKDENDNEINAYDSMWGLTLDVSDTEPVIGENGKPVLDEAGNEIHQKVQGYLTYQEIIDNIKGRAEEKWTADDPALPNQEAVGTVKWSKIDSQLDPNNVNAPATVDQILYIDGTPLYAMINSSQYSEVKTLEDLKNELNKNSLVFLPENTTSTLDNVAYKTSSGTFQAGKNIVLKDKLPFFSPYNIQVDAANYATYSREISGPGNILAQYATVVLPFTLSVTEGQGLHTNRTDKGDPTSDGFSFYLRKMEQLQNPQDYTYTNNNYYSEANFVKIPGLKTEANTPYMVEVTEQKSDQYSFVAVQYGSEIVATPTVEDTAGKGVGVKNFEGETVSNEKDENYLTNNGTYSGVTIHAKKEINGSIEDDNIVYYFNKNKYVSSVTLNGNKYKDVYIRPFRSYYLPSTSSPSKMIGFNIVYDQFYFDEGIATSIDKTTKPKVMTITTDKRCMLINALENVQVKIMSANGANMGSFFMNAGEQKQMSLPSGVYIVNKTKVIVK